MMIRRSAAVMVAILSLAVFALGSATGASAQRSPYGGGYGQPRQTQHVAGKFDYYALVLSWSPTYCADEGQGRNDPQCSNRGRPYGFVLHGLWPQYERGYPDSCRTPDRPFVPNRVIDNMLDIMPAKGLIIHEYKKHGTCSGLPVEQYFATARRLFTKVKIPARFDRTDKATTIAPRELVSAFLAANPGMRPDSIGVVCKRGSGNRLQEIRICLTKDGAYRSCGANEAPRKLCSSDRMYVPPVR